MNDTNNSAHWFIYGHDDPKKQLSKILKNSAPPWRNFANQARRTAYEFQIGAKEKQSINAAIYLRRPLLVTGDPGTGKSSLAYSIADKLDLDKVLVWPITSRATLKEALYRYDAIGRLQEANLGNQNHEAIDIPPDKTSSAMNKVPPIEKYLTLGPLGTALADSRDAPRVLLIDEIDKCDIDLPNDLLYIFEEGEFEIPELSRLSDSANEAVDDKSTTTYNIRKHNAVTANDTVLVHNGQIRCNYFPIVIMTSNGERELPAPFLRRCLQLRMKRPDEDKLKRIVGAHFTNDTPSLNEFVSYVLAQGNSGDLVATDQLMNAIYLAKQIILSNSAIDNVDKLSSEEEKMVIDIVMKSISRIRRS